MLVPIVIRLYKSRHLAGRTRSILHKLNSTQFTDGIEPDVFEDAEGRHFVKDDGELAAGQWLPPADEPDTPPDRNKMAQDATTDFQIDAFRGQVESGQGKSGQGSV
jgi:hypothetical protein